MSERLDAAMALLSELGVGVVVLGLDGKVLGSNEHARELIPFATWSLDEPGVATMAREIVDEQERAVAYEDLPVVRTMRTGQTVKGFLLGVRLHERPHATTWLLSSAHAADDGAGARIVVCSFVDVTAQRLAVDEGERRFRLFAENAADVIFRVRIRPELAFEYVNPAVSTVLGYRPEELYADPGLAFRVTTPADRAEIEARFGAAIHARAEDVEPITLELTRRDGTTMWGQCRIAPVHQGDAVVAVEGIVRDVTELKVKEADLSYQALHDPLTGLANRPNFFGALDRALAQARAGAAGVAVLYVDLDRFKTVNDSLGHAEGDRVLGALGARLADAVRPSDVVARIGGDEFAAVLPDVRDEHEAVQVARRLIEALGAPVPLDGGTLVTTASVGVAFTTDAAVSAAELLRRADVAMYAAKDRGRSRVECYSPPPTGLRAVDAPG